MMSNRSSKLARLFAASLLTALVLVLLPASASAQDQQPATQGQSDASSGDGDEFGQPKAQTAHVGAGTTNGSTTGYSGPESNVKAAPGENSLPPLPSADLCEPYADTPAYQSCLWVVLRQESEGGDQ